MEAERRRGRSGRRSRPVPQSRLPGARGGGATAPAETHRLGPVPPGARPGAARPGASVPGEAGCELLGGGQEQVRACMSSVDACVRIPAAVTGQPCSQEPAAWRLPKTGRGVRATRTLRQLSRGGSMAPRVLSPNLALWCKRVSSGTWRWVPSPRRRPCGTLSSTSTTSRRRISASSCASTSWKSASNRRARKAGTMSTGGTLS
ncbi:uncharacterized protein ACIB01_011174 isoform 2-T3 [Guaruba guarouba]